MDRGAWQASVRGVTWSDMTERLTQSSAASALPECVYIISELCQRCFCSPRTSMPSDTCLWEQGGLGVWDVPGGCLPPSGVRVGSGASWGEKC